MKYTGLERRLPRIGQPDQVGDDGEVGCLDGLVRTDDEVLGGTILLLVHKHRHFAILTRRLLPQRMAFSLLVLFTTPPDSISRSGNPAGHSG
jgi:hypothetical protein